MGVISPLRGADRDRQRTLVRERLVSQADRIWPHRLTLITGPAGAGKSTLLHQLAHQAGAPVAVYSAEPAAGSAADLLVHLELAATAAFDGLDGDWTDVPRAAAALAGWPGLRGLIVVDDLHVIDGTSAEAALCGLVDLLPDHVRVVVASRCVPRTNLSRLRVSGDLLEIDADDLRFRSWEVEQLFDTVYGERLSPVDAALLTRRTGGWAAGLQLFHLASTGASADERRHLLTQVATRSRHVRDYLAENVLAQLPDELRQFLLATFALGDHLLPSLCDEVVGRPGSAGLLEELVRRQVFTTEVDGFGTYRYHEVLRTHLEGIVGQAHGEDVVRCRHRAAAELLEREGALVDALVAFARGCSWDDVARLAQEREGVPDGEGRWLETLPPGMVEHDPWLLLARARRFVSDGALDAALASYADAAAAFGSAAAGERCRAESTSVRAWATDTQPVGSSWSTALRRVLRGEPGAAAIASPSCWEDHVVNALVAWLDGRLEHDDGPVASLVSDPAAPSTARLAGELLTAATLVLSADPRPVTGPGAAQLCALVDRAGTAGVPWVARVASSLLAFVDADDRSAESAAWESTRVGDRWGAALAHLSGGVAALAWGRSAEGTLARVADELTDLGAGSLAVWARAYHALDLARDQDPSAVAVARAAEHEARLAGITGARSVACAAAEVAVGTGVDTSRRSPLSVRCLGGLEVFDGASAPVDLSAVKPRARSVLRLLAVRAPDYIHCETIIGSLWPDSDAVAGRRSLQVAVSSLRSALDPLLPAGTPSMIGRLDDAYNLTTGPWVEVDLVELDTALCRARTARANGDLAGARGHLERAVGLWRGDLFPMEGPAEWVVGERRRVRRQAAGAALDLAELLVLGGELRAAVEACERGLAIDPYDDPLWRCLIATEERRGARAAAARARSDYARLLAELGVAPDDLVIA